MITDFGFRVAAICYHREEMPRVTHERAYPGIRFRRKSRNWWARLMQLPAECEHLDRDHAWMAMVFPDTLYLKGKAVTQREPARPEVSLCRECFLGLVEPELAAHDARVVAFEPDEEILSQYFFVGRDDLEAAGLRPETAVAIGKRLSGISGTCNECSRAAKWLWISRREVSSLDQTERIDESLGSLLCARHGAGKLCAALGDLKRANLLYVNAPYGDAGAYVWF